MRRAAAWLCLAVYVIGLGAMVFWSERIVSDTMQPAHVSVWLKAAPS